MALGLDKIELEDTSWHFYAFPKSFVAFKTKDNVSYDLCYNTSGNTKYAICVWTIDHTHSIDEANEHIVQLFKEFANSGTGFTLGIGKRKCHPKDIKWICVNAKSIDEVFIQIDLRNDKEV